MVVSGFSNMVINVESREIPSAGERRFNRRVVCFSLADAEEGGDNTPLWSYINSPSDGDPCLVVDISENGCAMLIPSTTQILPERCTLSFLDHDQSRLAKVNVELQVQWIKKDYSLGGHLVGVEVIPDGHENADRFAALVTQLDSHKYDFVRCVVKAAQPEPA